MTLQRTMKRVKLRDSQESGDLEYWLAQPVQARIDALEDLRRYYCQGQPHVDTRLQRVCRITQLKRS